MNGGIERWFEPIEPAVASGPVLHAIIDLADRIFTPPSGRPMGDWNVEAHQFRIEAQSDAPGFPTPEGLDREGVDWVLVMLINRVNVAEGVTKIHGTDRGEIGAFCLAAVRHGACPWPFLLLRSDADNPDRRRRGGLS